MKNLAVLLFSLFTTTVLNAQNEAIKIVNEVSKKEVIIKENRRIKIKTVDGKKISGKFIIENNSILINNEKIELDAIAEMKRNYLGINLVRSGFFIIVGAFSAAIVVVGVTFDGTDAYLFLIPVAASIFAVTQTPKMGKKFKKDKGWTYELIQLE